MAKAVITWDMEASFVGHLSKQLYGDHVDVVQAGKDRNAIYQAVSDADIILAGLADKEIMSRAPNLRFVQALTSSVGRVDLDYAASRGITVCSSKGHNANAVAEHTIMLMLMLARRAKAKEHIDSYEVDELQGKTVCVLGVGCVGKEVGKKCSSLGMHAIGIDLYPGNQPYFKAVENTASLPDFVSKSDFLTIHLPRTNQTHGIINKDLLKYAKRSLYIVDVSRAGVTDVNDIYEALKDRRIRGVAMDVFPGVFYPDDKPDPHPVFGLEGFIYTPHTAGKSAESRAKLAEFVAENIRRYVSGRELMKVVDPNVGF